MAKKLIGIRVSEEVYALLTKLAEKRSATQAYIVDIAIRDLAKKEGIK